MSEDLLARASRALARAGMTTSQAADALRELLRAVSEAQQAAADASGRRTHAAWVNISAARADVLADGVAAAWDDDPEGACYAVADVIRRHVSQRTVVDVAMGGNMGGNNRLAAQQTMRLGAFAIAAMVRAERAAGRPAPDPGRLRTEAMALVKATAQKYGAR